MLRRAILAFGLASVYPSFAAYAAQPLLLHADEMIR